MHPGDSDCPIDLRMTPEVGQHRQSRASTAPGGRQLQSVAAQRQHEFRADKRRVSSCPLLVKGLK
jgi:hypothetical protein